MKAVFEDLQGLSIRALCSGIYKGFLQGLLRDPKTARLYAHSRER